MRRSSVCNKLADLLSPDCKEYLQHYPREHISNHWPTEITLMQLINVEHHLTRPVWLIIQVHSWRYTNLIPTRSFSIAHHPHCCSLGVKTITSYHPLQCVGQTWGWCCNRVGYNLPEVMVDWVHWKEPWQVMRLTLIVPDVLQNKHQPHIPSQHHSWLASPPGRHPSGALNRLFSNCIWSINETYKSKGTLILTLNEVLSVYADRIIGEIASHLELTLVQPKVGASTESAGYRQSSRVGRCTFEKTHSPRAAFFPAWMGEWRPWVSEGHGWVSEGHGHGWVKAMVMAPWRHGPGHCGLPATGWPLVQRGRRHGGERDRLAGRDDSVDAGSTGITSRTGRAALCRFRGLTRVCYASEFGLKLRDLGFVMLGVFGWHFVKPQSATLTT